MADRIRIELGRSHQIKDLKVALQCLSKIGADLVIEGFSDKLVLTTINTAKSAFFAVTFYYTFFDGYSVESPRDKVQSAVLLKHVLATFRTQKILSMTMDVDAGQSKLTVTVVGDNRITKTYELDCMNSEVLNATVDKESYPTQVIAEAGELNKLLNSFQSNLDEITIIANPERSASAASMHRCCQLQSFYDPQKGGKDNILHTSLDIDTQSLFVGYRHRSEVSSDVTFNVKDFRSIVTLSEHQGSNIMLRLDQTGMPVVAETHAPGLQPEATYHAELILATLTDSQLPAAQHEQLPQWQGQQAQAPQPFQQPQQLAGPPAAVQDWSGAEQQAGAEGEAFDGSDPGEAHARRPDMPVTTVGPPGIVMEVDDPDPEQLPRTGQSPMPRPKPSYGRDAEPDGGPHPGFHMAAERQAVPDQHGPAAVDRDAAALAAQVETHCSPSAARSYQDVAAGAAGHVAQAPMQQPEEEYDHDGEDDDEDVLPATPDVLPATPDADDGMDQERALLGPGFIAD